MQQNKAAIEQLRQNLSAVIKGKPQTLELLLVALFSGGHVLIEDVPGTGKTTLAKALAASLNAQFSRIQFTPDLLPSDILGGMVYRANDGSFLFRSGPVFANIILADEINRASPRTQSALLEAMAERQVSIEGETRMLPKPFIVLATQNPIEYNGTYPLPEAQLDRFCMRFALGYPSHEHEVAILRDQATVTPLENIKAVMDMTELAALQSAVKHIEVEDSILDYIVRIITHIRSDSRLRLGVSPRGALDLRRCAQAHALLSSRAIVRPDDVQALALPVLSHRLVVESKAHFHGTTAETVVSDALRAEAVPR